MKDVSMMLEKSWENCLRLKNYLKIPLLDDYADKSGITPSQNMSVDKSEDSDNILEKGSGFCKIIDTAAEDNISEVESADVLLRRNVAAATNSILSEFMEEDADACGDNEHTFCTPSTCK